MNELIEQIYLKLADLEKEIFPGLDELDYFEDNSTYLTIPDDVKFCTLDNCDLFILIHRSFYQDEDFSLFKTKIKQNKKLLNENYTVGTLLKEINIISDEKLSEYKKEEK